MAIFKRPPIGGGGARKRRGEIPQGLFQKCPGCKEVVHEIELAQNQRVCPRCDYHFSQSAKERIENLLDPESFVERDGDLRSVDTLRFQGMASYKDRLQEIPGRHGADGCGLERPRDDRGLQGRHRRDGFQFSRRHHGLGRRANASRARSNMARRTVVRVIIVSASGGARMYEGMLSLMQMAKTSGALARHACERLPYISVLTNPTTAGVMASFASLGDVILAEPKSMIGFAGPRVIKETTHQDLPEGFQTAEFLEEHGLIDLIVHRKKMRAQISQFLSYFSTTQ